MSMNVHEVQWIAGQLENIAKSMKDSLKGREDLGDPVDNHHILMCVKQAFRLSKKAIDGLTPMSRDAFELFISELERDEDIALLLCTFLGFTREEISSLTVNAVLKGDSSDQRLLKALLERMSEEEILRISEDMDTRFTKLGILINKENMTYEYIRESGKAAGAFS
ncbi:hypothetical protein IAQ67_28935 (plasmid) [Paenibacillus peoriae]|uniref:Uncharacterized protein n=1 Tax=Paenibacillus peoriae TaxID=59893 RepID=A0A7H0YH24_9BACL|nr:hypothetical protein [Paenibacillus peoriae]QNR70382.1 hypothetical protein IAQ67_28935 [Paenibacillus peoriae]